jgi:hypothetical protein
VQDLEGVPGSVRKHVGRFVLTDRWKIFENVGFAGGTERRVEKRIMALREREQRKGGYACRFWK